MIITVAGVDVHCATGAMAFDAARPTVVFIHGALNDHSVWTQQSRQLADHGYGVLAIDLPGHGRSQGAALTSIEGMAAWLLAVFDAAGVAGATLVGHSMGSLIALDVVRQAPARVTALALAGTTYPMKVAATLLATARDDEPRAIDMVAAWSHAASAATTPAPDATRQLMHRVAAINPHRLLFTDLSACNQYAQGDAAAATVRCPTLFVLGAQDRMTPFKSTTLLTAAIPHGQVVTVNAGHQMMVDAPDAVSAALLAFVQAN